LLTCFLICALLGQAKGVETETMNTPPVALAIHGGAGTIERDSMTAEKEKEYRAGLEQSLRAGASILKEGGSSLDAVEACVRVLEDHPLFNAGRGSVFTSAGTNEMDAAIMDGKTLKAGAVAGLKHIRNPISLARLIMEKSPHVMLSGEGAEAFARENGFELMDPKYFFTQERWDALQRVKKTSSKSGGKSEVSDQDHHGTVGAVALDRNGNLAAATSTGGTTNKLPGRIGDSPIIGAGTYANNATCAVSATGDGEYFIRATVAHEVSALIENKGMSIQGGAERALTKVAQLGGTGGMIAMDGHGNVAMPFNTSGMYRGLMNRDGTFQIDIYK
jgi:L-asparaginase / beta-aspartyl-peptidase